MRRSPILSTVYVVALVTTACSSERTPPLVMADYFPLRDGACWTFRVNLGGVSYEERWTANDVETAGPGRGRTFVVCWEQRFMESFPVQANLHKLIKNLTYLFFGNTNAGISHGNFNITTRQVAGLKRYNTAAHRIFNGVGNKIIKHLPHAGAIHINPHGFFEMYHVF